MSKRTHEQSQGQSKREERWFRKMKKYEQKLELKRRGRRGESETPRFEQDVVNEEYLESNEGISETDLMKPIDTEDNLDDPGVDDISQINEAGPCLSPNPITEGYENSTGEDFDPELLRELGDAEPDPIEFGDDLQTDIAVRLQKILLDGLKKEAKVELLKKYPFPKNVPFAKGPTLNPEIGAMLVETCKQRDKRLLTKQNQLGKALAAVGKALTGLLKKNPDIRDVIRTLNDAGMLLADSHYAETDTRRSVIIPLVDKSLTDPFKDRKRDCYLFGEKLGDLVKDSRGIKKTGQMIQQSPSNSNLNVKGPSSRRARQQRGGQTYQHRHGGPRATASAPAYPYPGRWRATLPPPPPARRQPTMPPPPPPPPPPRRQPAPALRSSTSR